VKISDRSCTRPATDAEQRAPMRGDDVADAELWRSSCPEDIYQAIKNISAKAASQELNLTVGYLADEPTSYHLMRVSEEPQIKLRRRRIRTRRLYLAPFPSLDTYPDCCHIWPYVPRDYLIARPKPGIDGFIPADETAISIAMTKPGYDDGLAVIAPWVLPREDMPNLAFAICLEVADRLDRNLVNAKDKRLRCSASMEMPAARALEAAIAVARTHRVLAIKTIGQMTFAAADVVIGLARQFLAAKPRKTRDSRDIQSLTRWNLASIAMLGGASSEKLATLLGCDPRDIRKRFREDIDLFDFKHRQFCTNYKGLLASVQLPEMRSAIRYSWKDDQDMPSAPSVAAPLLDLDVDTDTDPSRAELADFSFRSFKPPSGEGGDFR
jgi:hypothetical protein